MVFSPEIRNIIFDFGAVLVKLTPEKCMASFRQLGVDISPYIGTSFHRGYFNQLERGEISVPQFCDEIRRLSKSDVDDSAIIQAWNDFLAGIPDNKLEALVQLSRWFNLYVLSNTNTMHWEHSRPYFLYREKNILSVFQGVFLSFEMHKQKPNPDIFEAVIRQAGLKPNETLFIDDARANCEAAEKLGMHVFQSATGDEWLHETHDICRENLRVT